MPTPARTYTSGGERVDAITAAAHHEQARIALLAGIRPLLRNRGGLYDDTTIVDRLAELYDDYDGAGRALTAAKLPEVRP